MLWKTDQRSQAQFDRAKWRVWILAPCWALQLGLTLSMVGLFSARLGDTMHTYKSEDEDGHLPVIEVVWESTNIGLCTVASVCTFIEIAKFWAESLTPWTMLFTHVIKLTCAVATLVLDIIVYVQRHDRHYSLIGLALDVAFIIISIALVIYSVLIYRRLSKYEDYAHPVNVKAFGFKDGAEPDNSYMGKIRLDKRLSVTSSRLSISSVSQPATSRTVSVEMETLERDRVVSPSVYTHTRDTQFDEYRARRSSVGNSERVVSAVSGDFAWPGTPTDDISRSSSLSAGGSSSIAGRARGLSAPRAPSWASDRGLVAVPEEDDEPLSRGQHDAVAREALLDPSHRDSVDGPMVNQEVDVVDATQTRYHQ